jgi:uncharacterized damage-inducible protein DinB
VNKQTLDSIWDQTRQKYGVYLRLLDAIPDDQYQAHPIRGMRTPAELVVHVSGGIVKNIAEGVATGAITQSDEPTAETSGRIRSRADAVAFARKCWADANAAVAEIGDAELAAVVSTPWNMSFPGWVGINILNDEFVHHRGQLYAYARACGGEPPFIWSFGDNEPGFAPSH